MNYVELLGSDLKEERKTIKTVISDNSESVFVYSGDQTLYDYINNLYAKGKGLDDVELYRFKVCYDKKPLDVSISGSGKRNRKITSMVELINELDRKTECKIIIENDDRIQLSFIVQQLIYIEYPLEKVDILLRKEEKDAEKTKRFMNNVNELLEGCENSVEKLKSLKNVTESEEDDPTKEERIKDIKESIESCENIIKNIKKAMDVELKLAVAASKKAGKSVIVNCFLGEEVAPTSTELATPNNCIYKKSKDEKYHLCIEKKKYDEDGKVYYDLPDEGSDEDNFYTTKYLNKMHDKIDYLFREAQNDVKGGFGMPDMHIKYVSDSNNFSSYTIFDTAGPDAAVSIHDSDGNETDNQHYLAAMRAMERCDVAIFAMDYSKYLTVSEESYLRKVKEMFTAQNKFHSLIFALNKIDVRYTDVKSPKSFIGSVEFIKTRLGNIDEAYKDCIIFPTCSLEYFSAIEAENAGVSELNAENNLPINEMRNVKFAHKDVKSLAWLHTHSENLEYYHGIETISYDVFKKDSGMPALMSYVSYVAQSKARDEIVNSVTYKIDTQKLNLQAVLNSIDNLEALINADGQKITEITNILTDYSKEVEQIVGNEGKFSDEDLSVLSEDSLFRRFKGVLSEAIKHQEEALKPACNKIETANKIYNMLIERVWDKLKNAGELTNPEFPIIF